MAFRRVNFLHAYIIYSVTIVFFGVRTQEKLFQKVAEFLRDFTFAENFPISKTSFMYFPELDIYITN